MAPKLDELAPSHWSAPYESFGVLYGLECQGRLAGPLMGTLGSKFPLEQTYNHIKRARKSGAETVHILLSTSPDLSEEQLELLEDLGLEGTPITPFNIPLLPPRTAIETKQLSSSVWPVVYRKARLSWIPTPLSPAEEAIAIARATDTFETWQPPGEEVIISRNGEDACGLRCRLYLGGMEVAEADHAKWQAEGIEDVQPLAHAVMKALRVLSERVRTSYNGTKKARCGSEDDGTETAASSSAESVVTAEQYYAAEADVYIVGEPCLMCAMALVHSRVRAVFLVESQSQAEDAEGTQSLRRYGRGEDSRNWWMGGYGSLGDSWAVQRLQALNHHYPVYRVSV